jgi:hypothetical protein
MKQQEDRAELDLTDHRLLFNNNTTVLFQKYIFLLIVAVLGGKYIFFKKGVS